MFSVKHDEPSQVAECEQQYNIVGPDVRDRASLHKCTLPHSAVHMHLDAALHIVVHMSIYTSIHSCLCIHRHMHAYIHVAARS